MYDKHKRLADRILIARFTGTAMYMGACGKQVQKHCASKFTTKRAAFNYANKYGIPRNDIVVVAA